MLHGVKYRYVPIRDAATRANSRLVGLRDAGHLVSIERAWKVNREITSFLESR